MKNSPPLISIIVPVYGVESFLRRCLDSIASQTYAHFECILVNDASPDGSPAICDEYAREDVRFIVVHKPMNQGLPLARKTGLEKARGEYVVFVDSDDWVEPQLLEKVYALAMAGNYDMVCFDYYDEHPGFQDHRKNDPETGGRIELLKKICADRMNHNLWNRMTRRNICEKVAFPTASFGEDLVITVQLVWFSEKIGYVNEALYHYYFNPASLTQNKALESKREREVLENFSLMEEFLKKQLEDNFPVLEPGLSEYKTRLQNPPQGFTAFAHHLRWLFVIWCKKQIKRFSRRREAP